MPNAEQREYRVKPIMKRPHGNAKTGLPFYRLEVGQGFQIPVEDYGRVNSARAHYQKRHAGVRFSSRAIRDKNDQIIGYEFRRET